MVCFVGIVQRAKDQIKAQADVPTFKQFIENECQKVLAAALA